MTPRRKKYLVAKTSERVGIDERKVDATLSFFWSHVRSFLQNPQDTKIFISMLGTFSLIPKSVEKYITDKEIYIERMDKKMKLNEPLTQGQQDYYKRCISDLVWLREMRDKLKEEKITIRKRRYDNFEVRKAKANMDQQILDSQELMEVTVQEKEDRTNSREEIKDLQN